MKGIFSLSPELLLKNSTTEHSERKEKTTILRDQHSSVGSGGVITTRYQAPIFEGVLYNLLPSHCICMIRSVLYISTSVLIAVHSKHRLKFQFLVYYHTSILICSSTMNTFFEYYLKILKLIPLRAKGGSKFY